MLKRPEIFRKETDGALFLPDFCAVNWLLPIVLIAQLLAFVIILSRPVKEFWLDLGLVSLFTQWIALSSAGVLCLLRAWLKQFTDNIAGTISYFILLLIVLFWSALTVVTVETYHIGWIISDANTFISRNLGVGAIVNILFLHYLYISEQWKRQIQAESEARFQALQSRIRPHFLFNSMNTIANLVYADPELAEEIIEDLSDLFRMSINDSQHFVTLNDELNLVEKYLHIEKSRLGHRLTVVWQVDDLPMQAKLPALILQPLLENAVYHGIEPLTDGGTITIYGTVTENKIIIKISNSLPLQPLSKIRSGHQIALDNIRQRLALAYDHAATLDIHASANEYLVVLTFPV